MEHQGKSLYLQIFDEFRERIYKGALRPGEQIPSERELCEIYKVSRITVRQAIYEAIKEGLLYRIQGKGTFVGNGTPGNSDPKIVQGLMKITMFSETLRNKGLKGKTKIIAGENIPGSFEINSILNLGIEEEIMLIKLVGFANDDPVVLYNSYFPLNLGLELLRLAKEKEKKGEPFSSYELYAQFGKEMPVLVDQTFEATAANSEQAQRLQIQEGCPLFVISSVVYGADNSPLEFKKAFYRGDRYKFRISRQAPFTALPGVVAGEQV